VGIVVAEVQTVVRLVVVEEVVASGLLVESATGGWLVGIVVEVLRGFLPPLLVFFLCSQNELGTHSGGGLLAG